jgi:hypothetical protein
MAALEDIATERVRQVEKGWTATHDDAHGVVHLIDEAQARLDGGPSRRGLVAAAALLVAAIETLDRLNE